MRRVEPFVGSPAEWDSFVSSRAGATHFHRFGWLAVIREALGHDTMALAVRGDDRRLRGVLPLARVKSRLFGHYLVSMPFLNYGGPIGEDEAVVALVADAVGRADADGVKLLELRSATALPISLEASHRKVTVVLELPGNPDGLVKQFPAKLRSQVRRSAKEGVVVRFGRDQVGPFYDVFARHMRDLGTPVLSRGFFETIADHFGQSAWFGCAWYADRPIACGAGFHWGDEFEMTWASALAEYSRFAPNMGLYREFMERCVSKGVARFNFGRCTPGSGTHRFKLQWGGHEEPLWWYGHRPAGRPASTPSPDRGAFRWGPRLWKHLPLSWANRLGPPIVRLIP